MYNRITIDDFERAKVGARDAAGKVAYNVATSLSRRLRLQPAEEQEAIMNIAEAVWCRGYEGLNDPKHVLGYYAKDLRKLRKMAFPNKASKLTWQHGKHGSKVVPIEEASTVRDPDPAPPMKLERWERDQLLYQLLDRLPPGDQALVLCWADRGPKSWSTIASELGIATASAAESKFWRIVARLRKMGRNSDFF